MLTGPGWLGLPRDIWIIAASALMMCSAALAQQVPNLRAAVARGRAMRRRERRRWARINFTGSDRQWLAELGRMRVELSGQLEAPQGRDWDPPGDQLGAWLETEQLWPDDPRRPPA